MDGSECFRNGTDLPSRALLLLPHSLPAGLLQRHRRVLLRGPKSMQKLLEEVRGTPHLLPVLQILLRGQGQGEDETTQQGLLFSVSYDGDG